MTQEIKEILDKLKKHLEHIKFADLTNYDLRLLLDYITNLQQIEKEHQNCTRKHWQQKCFEHSANEKIYKSRCEKAIEYIKKLQENDDIEIWRENGYWVYILNILNGVDKND